MFPWQQRSTCKGIWSQPACRPQSARRARTPGCSIQTWSLLGCQSWRWKRTHQKLIFLVNKLLRWLHLHIYYKGCTFSLSGCNQKHHICQMAADALHWWRILCSLITLRSISDFHCVAVHLWELIFCNTIIIKSIKIITKSSIMVIIIIIIGRTWTPRICSSFFKASFSCSCPHLFQV